MAVELLPLLESQAKKKQIEAGGNHGNQYVKVDLPVNQKIDEAANQKFEQPILQPEPKQSPALEKIKANTAVIKEKQSTEKAAALTGSNRQYVSDAKKIQQAAPAVE